MRQAFPACERQPPDRKPWQQVQARTGPAPRGAPREPGPRLPHPGLDVASPAFLPAASLATSLEGFDIASVQQQRQEQSYFVRLGSLSERLRRRAYAHSLGKLQLTRQRAQEALLQLAQALSLVSTPTPGGSPRPRVHLRLDGGVGAALGRAPDQRASRTSCQPGLRAGGVRSGCGAARLPPGLPPGRADAVFYPGPQRASLCSPRIGVRPLRL